jgi:hypothetical protein
MSTFVTTTRFLGPAAPWMSDGANPVPVFVTHSLRRADGATSGWRSTIALLGAPPVEAFRRDSSASGVGLRRGASNLSRVPERPAAKSPRGIV